MIQYPKGQQPIRFISVSPTTNSPSPEAPQLDVSADKSVTNAYTQPSQTVDPGLSALLPLIGSIISLLSNMLQGQGQGTNNFSVNN